MNVLLKNWLYLSKLFQGIVSTILILGFVLPYKAKAQKIGNYVFNGTFEEKYSFDPLYTLD